jgi:hypothetical protein
MGLEASSQGLAFRGGSWVQRQAAKRLSAVGNYSEAGYCGRELAPQGQCDLWNLHSGLCCRCCAEAPQRAVKQQINLQTSTGCKLLGTDGLAGELLGTDWAVWTCGYMQLDLEGYPLQRKGDTLLVSRRNL